MSWLEFIYWNVVAALCQRLIVGQWEFIFPTDPIYWKYVRDIFPEMGER